MNEKIGWMIDTQTSGLVERWVVWKCVYRGRKGGNVLFNDALNTFYLLLFSVGHMVKKHSDSERGNPHGGV